MGDARIVSSHLLIGGVSLVRAANNVSMQDRVVRQEPAHCSISTSSQLPNQSAACAKTSSVLVQIRFYPLDELRNGTLREGREDGHACMPADSRKLRVPAIASVTTLFHLAKNGDRTFDLLKILCNRSPTLKASDCSLNRSSERERNFAQKEPNNSNCPALCYN